MPSRLEWLWINLKIGALSFGGSGRTLLFQDALVRQRGWVSDEDFLETLTIAQLLPGPNLVNLSAYLSNRLFPGVFSAVAAVLALTLPGALLGLALVAVVSLAPFDPMLRGMSLGSIALFLVFLFRMSPRALRGEEGAALGLKSLARALLGFGVAVASILGVPLAYTLCCGMILAVLLEFLWTQ